MNKKKITISILALSALMLNGCSTVKPWARDLLAKPQMA